MHDPSVFVITFDYSTSRHIGFFEFTNKFSSYFFFKMTNSFFWPHNLSNTMQSSINFVIKYFNANSILKFDGIAIELFQLHGEMNPVFQSQPCLQAKHVINGVSFMKPWCLTTRDFLTN